MKKQLITIITALGFLFSPITQGQALPQAVTFNKEMIVTANPLASAAGAKILKQGGTAADAMVAAQTVLGLVEPQSSGLGGGAFVVYYDAKSGTTTTIDAREKAPSAATEDRFDNGLGFVRNWQSGLSVGVPGTPRMLEYMHDHFGRLPMKKLLRPAIKLAKKGFPLTQRTSDQVAGLLDNNPSCTDRLFFRDPTAFEYFSENCVAKPAGTLMINRPYADTLKAIARHGADAFYTGEIASNIAAAVQGDLAMAGDMTTEDLANYDVVEREPVCFNYRGHNVCGMGPPSSGALAVGQILGVLGNFDIAASGNPLDIETVHLVAQAGRLAFADRGLYVGDTDFVTVPVEGMLNEDYLAGRAALIGPNDMGTAAPGVPPGDFDPASPDNSLLESGTSHVSIVDRYGNALSMTTTIESSFGNGVMVNGFLLNNELTDFSFSPTSSTGLPVANRVQANKRPRSSMSPTIVFDAHGNVEIVTGSPGGSRIIGYTAQSIVNIIDFGLDPQQAINVPHYLNRNGSTDIEAVIPGVTLDYDAPALEAALEARAYSVNVRALTSGLSIIQVKQKQRKRHGHDDDDDDDEGHGKKHRKTLLIGGADHRRDGTVSGR